MARDYKILGSQECPRCGAKAKLKAMIQHPDSDTVGIVIDCSKCKLKSIVGFSSKQQMKRIERHEKLLKKYKEAKTPLERGKVMKEINKMDQENKDFMEGIFNS